MILHITEAKYLKDYMLQVVFNDGRKGVADLAPESVYFRAFKDVPELQTQFKKMGI